MCSKICIDQKIAASFEYLIKDTCVYLRRLLDCNFCCCLLPVKLTAQIKQNCLKVVVQFFS